MAQGRAVTNPTSLTPVTPSRKHRGSKSGKVCCVQLVEQWFESRQVPTAEQLAPARKTGVSVKIRNHWTTKVGEATGHPAAFAVVIAYAVLWIVFDRSRFDWNAVATLAVWMVTLFIQRSNRRDTLALHAKLDELLRVHQDARSELTRMDEQEPEEIARHRDDEVRKRDIEHPGRSTPS